MQNVWLKVPASHHHRSPFMVTSFIMAEQLKITVRGHLLRECAHCRRDCLCGTATPAGPCGNHGGRTGSHGASMSPCNNDAADASMSPDAASAVANARHAFCCPSFSMSFLSPVSGAMLAPTVLRRLPQLISVFGSLVFLTTSCFFLCPFLAL